MLSLSMWPDVFGFLSLIATAIFIGFALLFFLRALWTHFKRNKRLEVKMSRQCMYCNDFHLFGKHAKDCLWFSRVQGALCKHGVLKHVDCPTCKVELANENDFKKEVLEKLDIIIRFFEEERKK